MHGALQWHELDAKSLHGNPLGDPSRRQLLVYVPPGYEKGSDRLPVLYFLHGFTGSGPGWASASTFTPNVPERLDALIASGAAKPFLAVFPDGWTTVGGSQWVNSEAIGRYRDYLAQDVVPFVDQALRTVPKPEARAVIGHSSGGYGAFVFGAHHPELFGHIACHASDAYFEYCYLPDFPKAASTLSKAGGVAKWFEEFRRTARETKVKGDEFPCLNTVAMAAAYSPRSGAPLNLELPFELESGKLRPEIWAQWLEHDPVRFVAAKIASFRKLKTVFIDCGTRDEFNLRWGARMIAQTLKQAGIEHVHEEFEDGHSGVSYRYVRSVSLISPRLARS